MGAPPPHLSTFQENNWRNCKQYGHRMILYNDITAKTIEKHSTILTSQEDQAILVCKWRANLPDNCNIVQLYQYGIKASNMCGNQSQLYVVTERLYLLSQIKQLSKSQAFLILKSVINGLKILYSKFGLFNIKSNLIGINCDGIPKIWINQNFAKYQSQRDIIPIQTSQIKIVNNLIRILDSKTYPDKNFFIHFPRNLNFNLTINYVDNSFKQLNGFNINRVYINRIQYHQLKDRQQKEQQSKMLASQTHKKYLEIFALHEHLRTQQLKLAHRQHQFKLYARQQQQLLQKQLSFSTPIPNTKQTDQQYLVNTLYQPQIYMNGMYPTETTVENSQGKINKEGASTTCLDGIQQDKNKKNDQIISNTQLIDNIVMEEHSGQQKSPIKATSVQQTQKMEIKSAQKVSSRPPLPPKTNLIQQTLVYMQSPQKNFEQKEKENIKTDIEMVNSVILIQEEEIENQNERYIESQIIRYKI